MVKERGIVGIGKDCWSAMVSSVVRNDHRREKKNEIEKKKKIKK